jgi:branched-chain amino acid transport system ATP-binding protein
MFDSPNSAAKLDKLLEINGVSVNYGQVQALSSVSLSVGRNQVTTLLGSNSAGKSTLLRTIIGLVPLSGGAMNFDGVSIGSLSVEARVKMGIATVPEGRGILPKMTVLENLQMGGYVIKDGQTLEAQLKKILAFFPVLKERSHQMGGTLSGGEQQMLAIGRAMMSKPRLILMDEPSMGLAPIIIEHLFSIIQDINRDGTVVFLVEQNARMALSVAKRFYILQKGKTVLEGTVHEGNLIVERGGEGNRVLSEEELEETYLGT